MSSITTSNVTSGFIDLATFDEIEKYLYGGHDATAYFVRETRKATWFTQVPVVLSRAAGSPAFGQEWSVAISRAGDYMLHTWLRVTFPEVGIKSTAAALDNTLRLRWTSNLMHNLIRECCITFNDLIAARFDNYHLDFWAAFTVPASKRTGYLNMIGHFADLNAPTSFQSGTLPQKTLNLPLPFFYSRDSGVALPTAALPYNEMRINFHFRDWNQLLILEKGAANDVFRGEQRMTIIPETHLTTIPALGNTQVWANYAIVSNDERKRMACAPRDILVEQVQTAPRQSFTPASNPQQSFDIRFSHAIKVLFFAVRNTTWGSEWSNYTTNSPYVKALAGTLFPSSLELTPKGTADPIAQTSLIYENTNRLGAMGSDYFSLVNPWFHAPAIPVVTGYHMYSYSLDFMSLDPMGSTNYGKLTNVSIVPECSTNAVNAARALGADGSGATVTQTFEFIVTAINNNIIRVSGGALGFPVL